MDDKTNLPAIESYGSREMTLNEYQQAAMSTAIYPHDREIPYLALAARRGSLPIK